jgi:hypothetical protein
MTEQGKKNIVWIVFAIFMGIVVLSAVFRDTWSREGDEKRQKKQLQDQISACYDAAVAMSSKDSLRAGAMGAECSRQKKTLEDAKLL